MKPSDEDLLRRYLLGTLTPEARDGVERRLFSDDRIFWEHLCLVEEELIDDHAGRALDDESTEFFERDFLCTDERRAKLAFSRALRDHVERRESSRHGVWDWLRLPIATPRWAVAAAAVLLLLLPGAAWQFGTGRSAPLDVSAALSPGLVRDVGGKLSRVVVPLRCGLVRLDLGTGPEEYDSYWATLYEVSGDEIWSRHKLAAIAGDQGVTVTLTLPCELLPEGDYWIRLHGVLSGRDPVPLDRYDFRVLRP